MDNKFTKGGFYVCTCGFDFCSKYYQYNYSNESSHFFLTKNKRLESFGEEEASKLIPLEIYESPLFQAMKEEEST